MKKREHKLTTTAFDDDKNEYTVHFYQDIIIGKMDLNGNTPEIPGLISAVTSEGYSINILDLEKGILEIDELGIKINLPSN